MDIIIDKSKVPDLEWKWNENEIGYEGVRTQGGQLLWYTFRRAHNGNIMAIEQKYEDFIHYGPMKDNLPSDIMVEIYDVLMGAVQGDNLF
jgi:hypothetical protein